MKFETQLEHIGMTFKIKGHLSCADELEVDEVFVWTGSDYVEADVDVFEFGFRMEDYIREQIEQDAAAAKEAYYEDKYDEEKLEGL